jgi:hypothetical protein
MSVQDDQVGGLTVKRKVGGLIPHLVKRGVLHYADDTGYSQKRERRRSTWKLILCIFNLLLQGLKINFYKSKNFSFGKKKGHEQQLDRFLVLSLAPCLLGILWYLYITGNFKIQLVLTRMSLWSLVAGRANCFRMGDLLVLTNSVLTSLYVEKTHKPWILKKKNHAFLWHFESEEQSDIFDIQFSSLWLDF